MRGGGTLGDVLVGVLGPVTLLDAGGAVAALPGHRRQALLAALVARAGEVVSADKLVDLQLRDARLSLETALDEGDEDELTAGFGTLSAVLASNPDRRIPAQRGVQAACEPGRGEREAPPAHPRARLPAGP